MRDRLGEFGDSEIVVIAFAAPHYVAAYQRERLAPLTVLVDPTKDVYRAYGLSRGSLRTVWGPKIWSTYARLIRAGRRLQRPTEDTRQLGGDFVVDKDGHLAYVFRSEDPADRPAVDDLLAAVRDP